MYREVYFKVKPKFDVKQIILIRQIKYHFKIFSIEMTALIKNISRSQITSSAKIRSIVKAKKRK